MRRAILSSVLIIGATLAVVFSGGAFSAFSDEEQINGTVAAAIVDFELTGDGTETAGGTTGLNEDAQDEVLTITFNNLGEACTELGTQGVFAPGDECTITVNLTRDPATIANQLAVDLTVNAFSVGVGSDLNLADNIVGLDCDGVSGEDWQISYQFVDQAGEKPQFMPAGTADIGQQLLVKVELLSTASGNAGSGCQGSNPGTIAITIHAEQSATPHLTSDAI